METKKEKTKAEKLFKIASIILAIVLIITLIIIKLNIPEFSLTLTIILIFVVIIVFGVTYFGFEIYRKLSSQKEEVKSSSKLPNPITLVEAMNIGKSALVNTDYANHITKIQNSWVTHVGRVNKNAILVMHLKALYRDEEGKIPDYYFVVNMHYPHDKKAILENPTISHLNKVINGLSSEPELEPRVEKVIETSPLLGIQRETTKELDSKEEPEKKEDLK